MKLRLALAATASIGLAFAANGALAADATATATTTIAAPSQLAKTRDLVFGTIAKPSTGSNTVTVASNAATGTTPTITGGGDAIVAASGQAQSAAFRITAANTTQFTIQSRVLTLAGLTNVGSEPPVVSGASGAGPTYTMTGSQADIYIGGHFDVTTTTAEGTYNGTLNLTVNFN